MRLSVPSFMAICLAIVLPAMTDSVYAEEDEKVNQFTDLVNQHGKTIRMKLNSIRKPHPKPDLLKDKVVVVNSFFTTDVTVSPSMAANFSQLQKELGDRLGKDVFLITISVDPTTDTSPRLKAYADRFTAKPGWYFLTGKKANVETALKEFGLYVRDKTDVSTSCMIGNVSTGEWKKSNALNRPSKLLSLIDEVSKDAN